MFGIYRAPDGVVDLRIARPGHHALVVSAHDATSWRITATNGAVIDGVYAVGVHRQTVDAPGSAKVARDCSDDGGPQACGYSWPDDGNGCNTDQLLKLTGKIINHSATSFHGCREAAAFTVGSDLAVTSDCAAPLDEFVSCGGPDSCGGPILL